MALVNFWNITKSTALAVYAATVLTPLKRLYFDGPRIYGYGFWKGAAVHDICASLTNHDSNFWLAHPQACQEIIDKDFYAIVVLVETIGYFALLYLFIGFAFRQVSIRRTTEMRETTLA